MNDFPSTSKREGGDLEKQCLPGDGLKIDPCDVDGDARFAMAALARFAGHLEAARRAGFYSVSPVLVLAHLAQCQDGSFGSALARVCHVSPALISDMLKSMAARGLVAKNQPGSPDQRMRRVRITAKGRDLIDRILSMK
jgi:DNA-binding MarR family transcriptional regulator